MTSSRTHGGKLDYADYARIPPDGQRHEIIDGAHHVSPAPFVDHQSILKRLLVQLHAQVELPGLGVVFCAPVDVVLSPHDIVQPDLIAVRADRQAIITAKNIQGAPDLVVEILSPSTRRLDRGTKLRLYERTRVREYWIVDGEARSLAQHVLRQAEFGDAALCTTQVDLHAIAGVRIDLTQVWGQGSSPGR